MEDTAKTFALTGTDPNNLALTYSVSTQPQHGTISISGGAATYSPNANYHGQDVIAYLASSTNGNSNVGTIIITITPVDDEKTSLEEKINKVCSSMACHGSIRAGRNMEVDEMNDLLRRMEDTPFSGQCNHGRPTYVELKLNDIEKLFGRK